MSHKIAIITTKDFYWNDDYQLIATSVTDWQEISDEDFQSLQRAQCRIGGFQIIEQPHDTSKFVAKTIADYLKIVKADEKKQENEKKQREEAALARKLKKEAKDRVSRERLYAALRAEFEPTNQGDEVIGQ